MEILRKILEILDWEMETPISYGWFHLLSCIIMIAVTVYLCCTHKKRTDKQIEKIVFGTAIVVTILEIYKQINYSFSYTGPTITFDFQWYAFPWQFCSMPLYVGMLTGLVKNKRVKDALYAFLATYALFAGVCVMVYPVTVFVSSIGINIQTMFCHGSMVVIGCYLLYSGKVKLHIQTLWKALPVFAVGVGIAVILNEIAYYRGLLETDTFNMFFVSPHCEPHLPVYSLVQQVVPFPWCLIIYIAAFTLAAGVILYLAKGVAYMANYIRKRKVKEGK